MKGITGKSIISKGEEPGYQLCLKKEQLPFQLPGTDALFFARTNIRLQRACKKQNDTWY